MRWFQRTAWIRHADPILIQAIAAGAVSFGHGHTIAVAAGQAGWESWTYPVTDDLLLVAAWRRIRELRRHRAPSGAAWFWFVVALAASLGANVSTAGLMDLSHPPTWLRVIVAGWPAIAFFGGMLIWHGARHEAPEPAPQPVDQEPEVAAAEPVVIEEEVEPEVEAPEPPAPEPGALRLVESPSWRVVIRDELLAGHARGLTVDQIRPGIHERRAKLSEQHGLDLIGRRAINQHIEKQWPLVARSEVIRAQREVTHGVS